MDLISPGQSCEAADSSSELQVQGEEANSAPGERAQTPDDELLRRYSETGSQEAFAQIVYRHAGWVYNFCRRRLNDSHLAEDATQAVFLLLSRKILSVPPPVHLAGWLFQASRYVLAETRRNDKRYHRRQSLARDVTLARIAAQASAEAAPDTHLSAALDEALVGLRPRERQTILMHFYEGLTLRQMAEQLGISKEGIKKRVNRALAQLRRRLEGKVHRLPGREGPASIAVIFWLLRTRQADAAPVGLAQTIVRSSTVPGMSSSAAEWMVHGVNRSMIRATRKLLITLSVLGLELALLVPAGVMLSRGGGRGSAGTGRPAAASAGQSPIAIEKVLSGGETVSGTKDSSPGNPPGWINEQSGLPLPRLYLPHEDAPAEVETTPPADKAQPAAQVVAEAAPASSAGLQSLQPLVSVSGGTSIAAPPPSATSIDVVIAATPALIPFGEIRGQLARAASSTDPEPPAPREHPPYLDAHDKPTPPPARHPGDDFSPDRFPTRPPERPLGPQRFPDPIADSIGRGGTERGPNFAQPSHDEPERVPPHPFDFDSHRQSPMARHLSAIKKFSTGNVMMDEAVFHHPDPPRAPLAMAFDADVPGLVESNFDSPNFDFPQSEMWLANIDGGHTSALFVTPVPEPSSLAVIIFSTAILSLRRRKAR